MKREFAEKNQEIAKEMNRVFHNSHGEIVSIEGKFLPTDGSHKEFSFTFNAWHDNYPFTEHMIINNHVFNLEEDRLITNEELKLIFDRAKEVLEKEEQRRSNY